MKVRNGLLIMIICIILSGCGSASPSKKEIEEGIPYEIRTLSVENPFTWEIDEQELEITSLEIEKSKTTDSDYTAYCIVEMENDYYKFTKYLACTFEKYDGGEWVLNYCEEYKKPDFVLCESPFSVDDISYKVNTMGGGENISVNVALSGDDGIIFIYSYDVQSKYKTSKCTVHEEYYFDGTYWLCGDNYYKTEKNDWNIVGNWEFVDSSDRCAFELDINSFDSENLSGSGYCYFGYNSLTGVAQKEYNVENADVVERDDGSLIIMFDGNVNSNILGLGQDKFVIIKNERAYAYFGDIWRKEEISLLSQ